jgi:hypothetical protein
MSTRPREVDWAVRLLWISLGITILVSPIEFHYAHGAESLPGLLVNDLFSFGIESVFIWKISQGANWARITYLVFFLISVAFTILAAIFGPRTHFHFQAIIWVIGGVQILIESAALVLLFRKPGMYWFKGPPRVIRLASEQR